MTVEPEHTHTQAGGGTPASHTRAPGRSRRGVAIIIVMATIVVLTTSVVEYVYNTRVNLYLAQNHRDEVKAWALARSGINLQMLSLQFQTELEQQGGMIGQAVQRSRFQLWQYLDLLLPAFSSGTLGVEDLGSVDLVGAGATGFGDVFGSIEFHRPVPEEGKINLNAFAGPVMDQVALQSLCALARLPSSEDVSVVDAARANEVRFEVIAAIIDHIDPDSDKTVIDENCVASIGGAGNEISRYTDVTWEPKNEPVVTLDEIRMVPGVTDGFFAQYRDNLTVYPVQGLFYVNLQDAQGFAAFLCTHLFGSSDELNRCVWDRTAAFQVFLLAVALDGYVKFYENPINVLMLILAQSSGSGPGVQLAGASQMIAFDRDREFISQVNAFMSSPETLLFFVNYSDPVLAARLGVAQGLGLQAIPRQWAVQFDETAMLQRVTVDVPRVFTISATGVYGGASRTVTAVADFNEGGRLLYWREF